jgi:cob(I)alamin adenosyltransferase
MKIYTKTGDDGTTGLFGGPRVKKNAPRIEAYGAVDELNAVLGLVGCETLPPHIQTLVTRLQAELFDLGGELASPQPDKMGTRVLGDRHIAALEGEIDRYEGELEPLKQFILPGGTRAAALLHLARTVCRRSERDVITLAEIELVSNDLIVYLNRLSDLLFVLARTANRIAGQSDVPWSSGRDKTT